MNNATLGGRGQPCPGMPKKPIKMLLSQRLMEV